MLSEYLIIGQVVKPQGIRGEVKVRPITSDIGRFEGLESVYTLNGGHVTELLSVGCIRHTLADLDGNGLQDLLVFRSGEDGGGPSYSVGPTYGRIAADLLDADFSITGFTVEQNLEEAVTVKVTAKPTASGRAPTWV